MKTAETSREPSLEEVRDRLATWLREQLPEIERTVYERVRSISEAAAPTDPEYVAGVKEAAREAIQYAITGIESGERPAETIPEAAAQQARRAARSGIPLDAVLRRYHAGDRVLTEWITGAAVDLPVAALQEIARSQGAIVDHLTAAIAAEYMHEMNRSRQSPEHRLRDRIQSLLAGDRDRDPNLAYDLGAWHIGLIGEGQDVGDAIRDIGLRLDHQMLRAPAVSDGRVWVWLGGRKRPEPDQIEEQLLSKLSTGSWVALGEVHRGVAGWRLTHAEAQAALQVALYRSAPVTRCRNVVLESLVLRDPQMATSLIETYLMPLEGRGDSGRVLRDTLRAFFGAEQNAATAAHILSVDRATVRRRIGSIEKRLGMKLGACAPQLQVALAVEDLTVAARA